MKSFFVRPQLSQVILKDSFWTPYTEGIRDVMIPHCYEKFEEDGYMENFKSVASKDGKKHIGNPFSDGLLLETMTGTYNFLSYHYDKKIDKKLDELVDLVISAQQSDGYLTTIICQNNPAGKWGQGEDGNIIISHDLYNQGTMIEAAIAQYRATGKTKLLKAAVKCANNICSYIGEKPKNNVIPGHSLSEMAFIELYKLFRDCRELDSFAKENKVNLDEYLEVVRFWYDNRGIYEDRQLSNDKRYGTSYNQDTAPLAEMRTATGHAVRAGLCYQGAAAARRELMREDYDVAIRAIWNDVITKKLHISGGIGSRHDIEGFDSEYNLPNDAYLETCAGIALSFWAAEMNLISKDSEYFDYFELSLYNNILGAVSEDFRHYYYDNPLVNDGTKNRWSWHVCPCCPPMLAKIYSTLATYIYSYTDNELCVNMYMGSKLSLPNLETEQNGKKFRITVKNGGKKISFRIPAYAENFSLTVSNKKAEYATESGYAVINLDEGEYEIIVDFSLKFAEICANTKVEADNGRVCVMYGQYLMCAEGADNKGKVDFKLSENPEYRVKADSITAKDADGNEITLIPYYKRNNRISDNTDDSKMAVWFLKENMADKEQIDKITGDNLYGYYKIIR